MSRMASRIAIPRQVRKVYNMLARIRSFAVRGVEAYPVDVEVDLSPGLPSFNTVGLPDTAVRESRERVRAAIVNSGFEFPLDRITVNLAPADVRKEGPDFDLPIAVGVLLASGALSSTRVDNCAFVGELSLDGTLRRVKGALPMAICARDLGISCFLLPPDNASEAGVVKDITVAPLTTLRQAIDFLRGSFTPPPVEIDFDRLKPPEDASQVDFSDVRGQEHVKRALEVAAAGAHNVLMVGPPGSGKTMLARRLPTILPQMTLDEALETTKVHSVAGLLPPGVPLLSVRPFRSPHHTISDAGLIGGGAHPSPGEVSLAHGGVLFLDEFPEFRRNVLEALRQPLEDGRVVISRAAGSVTYPARFMLVASLNPCPCGHLGSTVRECTCTARQIQRYLARISGPLIDRIDLQVEVPAVEWQKLSADPCGEDSATLRRRVADARQRQLERLRGTGIWANAYLSSAALREFCPLDEESRRLLERAMDRLGLSARAYSRILKVARTIADLEASPKIAPHHVAEAIQYRSLDRTSTMGSGAES